MNMESTRKQRNKEDKQLRGKQEIVNWDRSKKKERW